MPTQAMALLRTVRPHSQRQQKSMKSSVIGLPHSGQSVAFAVFVILAIINHGKDIYQQLYPHVITLISLSPKRGPDRQECPPLPVRSFYTSSLALKDQGGLALLHEHGIPAPPHCLIPL